MCRLSSSQDIVSEAHGLTGLRPSYSLHWFNFAKYIQKRRGDSLFNTITSATTQKIRLNNCTHEQLFKALARVEAKLATTTIKDKNRAPHAVKSISDMSEHYVATDIDDIPLTRLGNPKYRGWLPSEFGGDRQYWEKKRVNPGKLLNDTYLNPHTGRQTGVPQTLSGLPVDTRSDAFNVQVPDYVSELYRVSSISPYGNSS